ncbi:unnamed protein product [Ambrosiozyma monospora]|uniref:Unnamed protein product n=1 Tax=Ambrosiozyma monospora TaxID=43982 RepID=A0A9W6WHM4_AMBMO|nr:unnamed protein product [Ambrosiozyma monospora]
MKPTYSSSTHSTITSDSNSTNRRFLKITSFPFTLPYRDPISVLQFSPNSQYLSVATALECRFLTVSIVDPNRPVLVMKSHMKIDTSMESEGITDLQFFPDNRKMALTALSYDAVPIVVDSKITAISGPEGIAHPILKLKVDEVGSMIHKCCVSPRGDSIAYLDRSGAVYAVSSPRMEDNDDKRAAAVVVVAGASRAKEAASLRFDRSGYKLYVLDRKGVLTIADFTAGTVEDQFVSKSKPIYYRRAT